MVCPGGQWILKKKQLTMCNADVRLTEWVTMGFSDVVITGDNNAGQCWMSDRGKYLPMMGLTENEIWEIKIRAHKGKIQRILVWRDREKRTKNTPKCSSLSFFP